MALDMRMKNTLLCIWQGVAHNLCPVRHIWCHALIACLGANVVNGSDKLSRDIYTAAGRWRNGFGRMRLKPHCMRNALSELRKTFPGRHTYGALQGMALLAGIIQGLPFDSTMVCRIIIHSVFQAFSVAWPLPCFQAFPVAWLLLCT